MVTTAGLDPHGCGCVVAITSHVLPKLGSVFICPFKQDSMCRQLYYSTPRKIDSGIVHRKKHCPECIEIRITMDKCKYEKMSLLSGRVLHHMMATTSKGKRLGNDGPKALLTAGPYCKLSTVRLQRYDSSYITAMLLTPACPIFPWFHHPSYSLQCQPLPHSRPCSSSLALRLPRFLPRPAP